MNRARRPTGKVSAVLEGTVLGADGHPVAGVRVVCIAAPVAMPEIAAVTDAVGRFTLAAPAPGDYTLEAYADPSGTSGAARASITVTVSDLPKSEEETESPLASPDSGYDPNAEVTSEGSPTAFPPPQKESRSPQPARTIPITLRFGGTPSS